MLIIIQVKFIRSKTLNTMWNTNLAGFPGSTPKTADLANCAMRYRPWDPQEGISMHVMVSMLLVSGLE